MSEYLVRWKYGSKSLLNSRDEDTEWYYQFHSTKDDGVNHYTTLLLYSVPVMKITVEIFQMAQLTPGQPEPESSSGYMTDNQIRNQDPKVANSYERRNIKILDLHSEGYSNREIATTMDLSYQTVYGVIRKSKS